MAELNQVIDAKALTLQAGWTTTARSAVAGIAPGLTVLAAGQSFNPANDEICDAPTMVKTFGVSGTEGMGFQDKTAYVFKASTAVHRPGQPTGKIFSYGELLQFARQEVCDDLDRATYISITGTEGSETNNKNEPWYWEISFNRWNISYHYPELMV